MKDGIIQYCIGVDEIGQKLYVTHNTFPKNIDKKAKRFSKFKSNSDLSNKPKGKREKRF
jgi:hypothetical protein